MNECEVNTDLLFKVSSMVQGGQTPESLTCVVLHGAQGSTWRAKAH
jgi:hypothetical protein